MSRPFENIRILDLTHVLAGPFCAYQFALLGADVIKIEPPGEPDCARGRGPDKRLNKALRGLTYQVQASNKRALAVDLRTPEGREILTSLLPGTDVFLENYRDGVMEKLGFGYRQVREINPAIVYCSLSGYGPEAPAPAGGRGAYDNVIQAASGVIAQSGGHKPGVSFVDYASGYNAAFAVAAALYRRARDGRGMAITCSMFETALMTMAPETAAALHPCGNAGAAVKEPGISSYPTADGVLMLGAFTPRQYRRLGACLDALGHDGAPFEAVESWEDVWARAEALRAALAEIFLGDTAQAWVERLAAANLPAARRRDLREAASDPQLAARGFFHVAAEQEADTGTGDCGHKLPVAAYKMSEDGPAIDRAAPGFGQHTDEILRELGVPPERIAEMREKNIIQ